MSAADVNSVLEQFSKATSLGKSELSFAGKGLKLDTEEDAKEVAEAISAARSMQILRLEGNTVGVEAAKGIAAALQKHPEFERAKWSDMFTGRLKSEIPHALKHLGNAMMASGARLVELDLSDNAFGPNGMDGLMDFLTSKSCFTLQELRLNNNGLGVTGGKMLARCLVECHKAGTAAGTPLALRVFVSGRGRLENEGSIALAGAFKAMGSLEEVQMPQNGITHPGITALAEALAENKNLHILNLNDNTFTEKGAIAMAKALPHMTNLEVLNFGDCLLHTEGAKAIANAIKDGHTALKTVNLSFNEITMEGGNAIAEAVENKTNLDVLELDGNQFGEEGIELVRATMESMGKLELLGSLSEDEGTGDEDEDDEEDDEDVPEDEEDEIVDGHLTVNGVAQTTRTEDQKPVTASEFLQFPSPRKLKQIGSNRASLIVQQLGTDIKDVEKAVKAFMKVSSVVTPDDDELRNIACECADAVFTELMRESSSDVCCMISNTLLIHLGLLKSEDKKSAPSDISGPLLVLEHVVQQAYFPKSARGILQVFISRPHPLLEASEKSRHRLLQTLYQF